ncbi:DnaJ family domain-containing protein [Streptomyces sp. NPDC004285]
MTERKPPGVSFESFVDKQIREAAERGEFRALPGFGKPLPDDSAPYDELWWIKGKMHREGASVLPPSLALRKAAEDAEAAVAAAVSESQVRRVLGEINTRIAEALARPPAGPPLNLRPFDVEAEVERWKAGRRAERNQP